MKEQSKYIIGRREQVDLPLFNLFGIDAKIDTGAFTSSIHCTSLKEIDINGSKFVKFRINFDTSSDFYDSTFELPILKKKEIRSSNGTSELRIIIQSKIKILDFEEDIELSLTNRSQMRFPLLIGRKFLKSRYIVDVSKKNLSLKLNGI